MKIKYIIASALGALALSACNDFLDHNPDNIYTDDVVFGDQSLYKVCAFQYVQQGQLWPES